MDARWTDEELALAAALDECLQAIERGEGDLDSLADRYPAAKPEIRPLLEIAAALRARRLLYPVPAGPLRSLRRHPTKPDA
ncbi:MAG: hypothetical protein HYY03_02245 [Chloroflexi bacterium]|nr:hypothetical protein [Chloroflexota bacterium]